MPPFGAFVAVGFGAAVGAWIRWALGVALNPIFPSLPLGTLAANLCGGLLMGVAMELATLFPNLSPEVRLLLTTGFLGGLTTFSTFSGEITVMLLRRDFVWGVFAIAAHVAGSIALTIVGVMIARALFASAAA